ncbi:hypothetical protein WDU94_011657, partial [Cyamophila willieti]
QILLCDNLNLPFRDESFDAVLSIAVIHHFTTTERRVVALQELTRVLRIGGRIIISVWAMEQKNRKVRKTSHFCVLSERLAEVYMYRVFHFK